MVARAPTTLTAASWDQLAHALLPDGAHGTVHSVFERAFNLTMSVGELVGIVGPDAGNGPATIVLSRLPSTSFAQLGLDPGIGFSVDDGRLTTASGQLVVNPWTARIWNPLHVSLEIPRAEVGRRVRRAASAAAQAAPASGLGALLAVVSERSARSPAPAPGGTGAGRVAGVDPIADRALAALDMLHAAIVDHDEPAIRAAARTLSGLGPGLTPSGDDALAGFLIGLARARGSVDERLGGVVVAATEGRTTDIAAARVRHAASGRIEERQEDVIRAILTGDGTDLEHAARRAVAWGHTSGADTLVGLLLGLRVGLT